MGGIVPRKGFGGSSFTALLKGLVILVVLFLAAVGLSTAADSFLQPVAGTESTGSDSVVEHHSHPTLMSLQGKVEGINDGNVGVKVSDQNSCSSGVFFDYNYANAIQDSLFNLSLGSEHTLNLNYNQDYYMCLYVNGELVDGPQLFRGGQGQIDVEDVNTAGFATEFVPYSGAGENVDLGSYDLKTTGNVCFNAGCNAKIYYDSETGDVVIKIE